MHPLSHARSVYRGVLYAPMSIWDSTDREAFGDAVAELHSLAPSQDVVQSPSTFPDPRPELPSAEIPPSTERQLVDDFAFLAPREETPKSVAAATIQHRSEPLGLRLSLAANEGIVPQVSHGFAHIIALLQRCASCRVSRGVCASQLLQVVIGFHRNRMLGRLGSPKADRDVRVKYGKPVVIVDRLRLLADDIARKIQAHCSESEATRLLLQHLQRLVGSIEAVENATPPEEPATLEPVIKLAFAIAWEDDSLLLQLRQLRFGPEFLERKEVRQVRALGNYWRICTYLVQVSRVYRIWFRSIELNIVPSYRVQIRQSLRQYVHAEIQLLVYHQVAGNKAMPRFIGTSKMACFLCFCFIHAHGIYHVPELHGKVILHWTVPDRADYNPELRASLGNALRITAAEVKAALLSSKTHHARRGPAKQSVINVPDTLRSPSVSTLLSTVETISSFQQSSDTREAPKPADSHRGSQLKEPDFDSRPPVSGVAGECPLLEKPNVLPDQVTEVKLGEKVTLLVSLESPSGRSQHTSASCHALPGSDKDGTASEVVELTALADGNEVVLDAGDGAHSLSMVFVAGKKRYGRAELRWHTVSEPSTARY